MDTVELTDTQVLKVVKPFLPAGPVAVTEAAWAAQLAEWERNNLEQVAA